MGQVVYEGPSLITGKPIVAIITGENGSSPSSNPKTGAMVQLWILDGTVDPVEAIKTGADRSVCGRCPLMGKANGVKAVGRKCYTNVAQAPLQIYKKWLEGVYPKATSLDIKRALAGRRLRLGAYGDPTALPVDVLRKLVKASVGHTGYTHQWREARVSAYRKLVMASVEDESGAAQAQSMGWRTFRVRKADQAVLANEIICPASAEANKKRTCETCMACDGYSRPGQRSVVIIEH